MAHLVQLGSSQILTDEVFDYIFLAKELQSDLGASITKETLMNMKAEFEYWYPWDLRVSAKDLIPNHLTMSLYNHVEIWKDRPEMWPRGIYCNGHIMVDAEKMSKGKGNFLMMLESVEEYSADATRFALADSGDSMEDANFDRAVANNSISYLFTEEAYVKEIMVEASSGKLREGEMGFMDNAFNNEMDYLIEAAFIEFEGMRYRDGIHRCWYDLLIARDLYRDWTTKCEVVPHKDVMQRFVRALVVMMAPITPHWSEELWAVVVLPEGEGAKSSTVCDAQWPSYKPYDRLVRKKYNFFRDTLKNMRQVLLKDKKVKKGVPTSAYFYYASIYEPSKIEVLKWLQTQAVASTETADIEFSTDLTKTAAAGGSA